LPIDFVDVDKIEKGEKVKAKNRITLFVALTLMLIIIASCAPEPTATPVPPTKAPPPPPAVPTVQVVAPTVAAATKAPSAVLPTLVPTAVPPTPKVIKPGRLEVGVQWAEGSAYFDKIVKPIGDSLEKDYPGTKVIYTFNNTAARPSIELRLNAGDPIDIDVNLYDGTLPTTWTWVDRNFVMDLTGPMNEKRADSTMWKDDFAPFFASSMKKGDKIYGAPEQVYVMMLHYNKKMFDQWGLKPPTTWSELLQVCDTIKQKGGGVAPIAVTGQNMPYVGQWWDHILQRTVGTQKVMDYLFGENESTIANDPDFLKAAEEFNKLSKNGYLIDGWQGTDFTTAQVYFFQGKAAMMMMGSWLMTEMKDSIPPGFELAVAPFPSIEGGKGNQNATFGRVLVWGIPAATKSPDLAVEYLRRFTGKDAALKRVELLGAVSPHKDAQPPKAIIGADSLLKNASNNEFVIYYWGSVQAKFGLSTAWYSPLVEMWSGKLTPKDTLAKIDANIKAVRDQRKAAK
jgi:raffinose/stachyose/melibiose transport system substrate-binding protein